MKSSLTYGKFSTFKDKKLIITNVEKYNIYSFILFVKLYIKLTTKYKYLKFNNKNLQ